MTYEEQLFISNLITFAILVGVGVGVGYWKLRRARPYTWKYGKKVYRD